MTSANFKSVIILLPEGLDTGSCNVRILSVTCHLVHILQMPAKVAALSECLVALRTVVGPLTCVLAEVIPQIAALLEDLFAARVHTSEILLDALCHFMFHLNGLMPLFWDAVERP